MIVKAEALVPVEEYLRTTYDPDCDYVDGEVLERNLGERDHSTLLREFIFFFRSRREKWKCFVFPEQRVQVSPTRFRIPDICVYIGEQPQDQIFRTPPFCFWTLVRTYSGSISSLSGSNRIRLFWTYAMLPRWEACADRCPIHTSPFGRFRERQQSRKFST